MRGQINYELEQVSLRSIRTFVPEIKRCRSLLMIACETSYLSCIASRQLLEELTELLVLIDLSSDFLDRSILFLLSDSSKPRRNNFSKSEKASREST
jgi:glucosamine--fructose-6-phosphate aminotransferase (isomerizing)